MAPNLTGSASGLFLAETEVISSPVQPQTPTARRPSKQEAESPKAPRYVWRIVWRNVLAFIYLHTVTLYGLYQILFVARWYTIMWSFLVAVFGAMGVTAGAHRLWAHRAYRARWPLRLILAIFQTMAFQNHIYEWVRDHRVHHKFTDTDADPHNSSRGFFFSHIGWLMVRKHKDVRVKGKTVDMSDLEKDWIVMYQKKVYVVMVPIVSFFFPAWVAWYFWGESAMVAWNVAAITRYTLTLNVTWLVNSAAHIWGTRPYDKTISPTENFSVAVLAFGEGWHNYHHAFPWDYKTSELSGYKYNLSTGFIDFFAKIGWAYDLKTAPLHMVMRRAARKGDGTYEKRENCEAVEPKAERIQEVWGWGDMDMPQEEKDLVDILHREED